MTTQSVNYSCRCLTCDFEGANRYEAETHAEASGHKVEYKEIHVIREIIEVK